MIAKIKDPKLVWDDHGRPSVQWQEYYDLLITKVVLKKTKKIQSIGPAWDFYIQKVRG
jgi:hypothetical protein